MHGIAPPCALSYNHRGGRGACCGPFGSDSHFCYLVILPPTTRFKERACHRSLGRKRQRLRAHIRAVSSKPGGKRSICCQGHLFPQESSIVELGRSAWIDTCLVYNDLVLRNAESRTGPSSSIVVNAIDIGRKFGFPSKARSKSRSYGKQKGKEKEEKPKEGQWQVFPDRAPWVTSTPSRATSYQMDAMQSTQDREVTMQQSFSPVPPPPAEASEPK